MKALTLSVIAIVVLLVIFFCAVKKDINLEKNGTADLRNRVVGARMQKDGVLPYFHENWQRTDDLRYYDPANMDTSRLSNMTATPFFHVLLYPIVELPQRQISYIWLVLEYLMYGTILLLACILPVSNYQRLLIVATGVVFLYSEAWNINVLFGQLYIVIPFLAMIIYFCLNKRENLLSAFIAGITAVTLVLVRPNAIILLIPYLFLIKKLRPRYLIVFGLSGLLLIGYHFSNKNNRLFWNDYKNAIAESIKVHQSALTAPVAIHKYVSLAEYEGWNEAQIEKEGREQNITDHSEHGNVFVIYYHLFHSRIPLTILNMLSFLCIAGLLLFYYYTSRKDEIVTLPNLAILGFCLYMITDFFSPVWRHGYNGVQWIFPLVIAMSVYKVSYKWIYLTLAAGIFLNIVNSPIIKMEHTIGEYLFLLVLLSLALARKLNSNV